MTNAVHHIELWAGDLGSAASFEWLFDQLGWEAEVDDSWPQGRIWRHDSGVYVVLEASTAVRGQHDRCRPGMNHLALRVTDVEMLNRLRAECDEHGWTELFADRYPHAGRPDHTALYMENDEGFEIELVAD